MRLIPAIDLRHGQVVRLVQGEAVKTLLARFDQVVHRFVFRLTLLEVVSQCLIELRKPILK